MVILFQVMVNESAILVIGGERHSFSGEMLNLSTMRWSWLPNRMRYAHGKGPACGLVNHGGKRGVVVAGGTGNPQRVEILDLDTLTWRQGTRV